VLRGRGGWLGPAGARASPAPARRRGHLVEVELGTYELYLPGDEALAAIAPVFLLVSENGLPFSPEITGRLGQRLSVAVATTPGTHAAYHDHPRELADIVRPFLRQVSGVRI
jgi:pimeloyl-ACP methyl ester carboxylesterase